MIGLGDLAGGGFTSVANDVSADGLIVVGSSESAASSASLEAFRWTQGGGMIGLGDFPGGAFRSFAEGISSDGSVIVGCSQSTASSAATTFCEAFRWTQGGGLVALGDLAGGDFNSVALGTSADGSVIVGRGTTDSGSEAFRWTQGGGMIGLGDLAGGTFSSLARATSSDGSVVVGDGTTDSGSEAFIWDSANGMQNLNTVMTNAGVNLGGFTLVMADDISSDGCLIVGTAINPTGDGEAYIADVCQGEVQFPVGGKIIPIETTSLLLAGAQTFSWMIPVILSVLGIGLFVVSRKSE